ncbi:MAG TPA: hypothetical protein VMZ33_02930, partial [Candidatus Limnocylindrales bacterium]|nr:hypothetical protein [Candidatus Limnocylindrales bacterium]
MTIRGLSLALALMAVIACTPSGQPSAPPAKVTLLTHSSFAISDSLLAAFRAEHGVAVEILRGEDAGSMVNQAIL